MKVKNLDREKTIELIDALKCRIGFNCKLNSIVKSFMKEHDPNHTFNGFHDMPTQEMKKLLQELLDSQPWMDDEMKNYYMYNCAEIFGQGYGPHVNSYVLRDLHDCEKHLQEIELAADSRREENAWFRVERDLSSNRMNLYFKDIPEEEVRVLLKKHGFRWSSYYGCWTRQLTGNAETSLNKLKVDLKIIV